MIKLYHQNEGCLCNQFFIGNNCNQLAKKIVEEDDQILTLNSLPIFFYFNIKEYEGETIILELEVIKFLILD